MTDDDLLTPKSTTGNDQLKADLLARTSRRVRTARRVRVAGRVVVCLMCLAAGAATTFLRADPEPRTEYVYVREAPVANTPAPPVEPKRPPAPAPTPAELELAAEQADAPAEAARKFREAGDRYLREYADYQAAIRCYRNFLDGADPADRAVGPDDTWLLTSLKRAREQENTQ